MKTHAWLLAFLLLVACSVSSVGTSNSAVGGFPGCAGSFSHEPSPTGQYFATDFGCSSSPYFTDPSDACGSAACIQSAYDEGVCDATQSHANCQRTVNWYSIGGARYGCGTRLRVTNPASGSSVVVMVLDDGPSCTVENKAGFWVLDVSYPTILSLFGSEEGYSDHALVNAVVVDPSTPLGPTSDPPPPPAVDASSTSVSCATDGDCNTGSDGSGQICQNGACVPGCNADWECPGTTTCIGGQCQ